MMIWNTPQFTRTAIPAYITEDDVRVPTAPLVARQAWVRLAAAGYLRERREPLPAGVVTWGQPYVDPATHEAVYPPLLGTDAERLQRLRSAASEAIKSEAQRRIHDVLDLPAWKQSNMQTSALLTLRQPLAEGRALSIEELAGLDPLVGAAQAALGVRSASDQIEAWTGAATIAQLAEFDAVAPPAGCPQWP